MRSKTRAGCRILATLLFFCLLMVPAVTQTAPAGSQTTSQEAPATFNPGIASRLLTQITDGLEGHLQKQVLDAFDLPQMKDGQAFRNQMASFFDSYASVRIHFHLNDVSMEGDKGVATADVEMELEQRDSALPPLRKKTQLRLIVKNGLRGWKIIDIQPRAFFS
ncbi:MAG TPA: hypothetical protein VKT33_13775 [Candidatus Angelobacter sp.]|nr:hypothetical protein [Candidatus Angelobacter sp.]